MPGNEDKLSNEQTSLKKKPLDLRGTRPRLCASPWRDRNFLTKHVVFRTSEAAHNKILLAHAGALTEEGMKEMNTFLASILLAIGAEYLQAIRFAITPVDMPSEPESG